MNQEEKKVSDEAMRYVKEHKHDILKKFIDPKIFASVIVPVSIFMAGSPGAGKTEYSQRLISERGPNVVRVDADEVRVLMPQYDGKNSYVVQAAAAIGVEKLYDHVLKKKLHCVMDGTFSNLEKAKSNIQRSIRKGRVVQIFYLYQDPLVAWEFTKKREALEHRNIPKDAFVNALYLAKENVQKVKKEFGDQLVVNIVLKDFKKEYEKLIHDVVTVDQYVEIGYTKNDLLALLL
ncbi:MAG: zeta toxin family protein [bacterium]|nr:zeta toxin family protein [bacterium]